MFVSIVLFSLCNSLQLFVFSTENWKRSSFEIAALLRLIEDILRREVPLLRQKSIKVNFMGNRTLLPRKLVHLLEWYALSS